MKSAKKTDVIDYLHGLRGHLESSSYGNTEEVAGGYRFVSTVLDAVEYGEIAPFSRSSLCHFIETALVKENSSKFVAGAEGIRLGLLKRWKP